jgi:hypothetical protein
MNLLNIGDYGVRIAPEAGRGLSPSRTLLRIPCTRESPSGPFVRCYWVLAMPLQRVSGVLCCVVMGTHLTYVRTVRYASLSLVFARSLVRRTTHALMSRTVTRPSFWLERRAPEPSRPETKQLFFICLYILSCTSFLNFSA